MTKEFEEELKKLKYKSMADFSNRIDEIKDMDDKLEFVKEYILTHREYTGCSLDEAINIARMKIADAIVKYKEMKEKADRINDNSSMYSESEKEAADLKPYGNVLNNKNLYRFMNNPKLYLKLAVNQKITKLNDKLNKNDILTGIDNQKLSLYENNLETLEKQDLYLDMDDKETNYLHIKNRLEAKFGDREALFNAVNNTKPGFFSRMFNTTSTAGKNLLTAYKGFNDSESPLYGRKDTLERAATAYLKHLFPNFDTDYPLPDKHLIDGLKGTQKSRAILCNAILESIRKENKMIDEYNDAINDKNENEFDMEDMNYEVQEEVKKTKIIDLDKEVNESFEDSISEDNNEIVDDNQMEI